MKYLLAITCLVILIRQKGITGVIKMYRHMITEPQPRKCMRLVIVTQSINHFNQVGHIVPCCFKTVFMNNLLFILAVVLIIG